MSEEGDLSAFRALVRGRVQGVGFRDGVWRRARSLSLRGYVRNGNDGRTLEVVAEGPRESLEQITEYLWEGPRLARVEEVEVTWNEAQGGFAEFRIEV